MAITENVLDSGMRVWTARPEGTGPFPVMLMLHERYGPVEHSFNVIERAASYGFAACFPDLFHRYEGDRGALERSEDRCDPTDAHSIADIDETLAFLRAQPYADTSKIGIVGFCQSGRIPMVYAASGRDVAAIGVFHGGIYDRDYEPTFPGQESASGYIPRVNAPILGGFGERDSLVPLANVRRFRGELEALGKRARIRVFSGALHAWMNSTRPDAYNREATEEAWRLIADFFSDAFNDRLGLAPRVEFIADDSIDFDFSAQVAAAEP